MFYVVMLNVLLAQSQQVRQPARLGQVMFGSSLDGSSSGLLDHKEQQQNRDETQTRSDLKRGDGEWTKDEGGRRTEDRGQRTEDRSSVIMQTHPQSPVPVCCQFPDLRAGDVSETAERGNDMRRSEEALPV